MTTPRVIIVLRLVAGALAQASVGTTPSRSASPSPSGAPPPGYGNSVVLIGGPNSLVPQYYAYSGDGGPATSALDGKIAAAVVDSAGNVYASDSWYCTIRRIDAGTSTVHTVAGHAG